MVITHLSLSQFRNYRALELDLPQGVLVFQGDNAQGKTNLLEAPYLLATIRSHRAENERELISLDAQEHYEGLRTYIYRLRQKIEPDPEHPIYLVTRHGFGYMLSLGASAKVDQTGNSGEGGTAGATKAA